MKTTKLFFLMFFSIAVAACGGGGGGGTTPVSTVGSISGETTPGAIVGLRCLTSTVQLGQTPQSCTVPAFTTTADANGNYSFTGITQKGFYNVWASHGGFYSDGGTGCDFNPTFFNCNAGVRPLLAYTPHSTLSSGFIGVLVDNTTMNVPYSTNTDTGIENISSSNGLATGIFSTGARTITDGARYEWNDSSGNHSELGYDSVNGVISFVLSPSNASSGSGVICSVGTGTIVNGLWYYPCSSFGVTFNSGAGTISFAATPIYQAVGVYGVAYPYTYHDIYGIVVATGSLTFSPF